MLPPENGRAIPVAMAGPPCRRWVNASRSSTRNGMAWDSMGPHGRQTTEHGESMPRQTFPASHSVNLKKALTGGSSAVRGLVGRAIGKWRRATGGQRYEGDVEEAGRAGKGIAARSPAPPASQFATHCPPPRLARKNCQSACKPGSVGPRASARRDGHSSGTVVADRLEQPTRATGPETEPCGGLRLPSPLFGLAPGGVCRAPPLPVGRCALTAPFHPYLPRGPAVCFLWHYPWGRPRRTLSGAVSPWSPDFPRSRRSGRPADWPGRQ